MVFGTPHYMSPEQAMGDPVDHRTDIYALGVVMYEMFTARVPFEADSYMGVLTKHMYVAPTPPSQLMSGAKELGALESIMLRCLEKKPQNRFATMSDLLDELDRIIRLREGGELDLRASNLATDQGVRNVLADELEAPTTEELRAARALAGASAQSLRTWLRAGIGAGGALLLALSAWWVGRSMGQPEPAAVEPAAVEPAPVASRAAPPEQVLAPVAAPERTQAASSAPVEPPAPASRPEQAALRRSPASRSPARAPASQPAMRPKKPKRSALGAGDIVDPWAE
jgi:eukaryotic-like serine/threonine-protein kinase